MLSWSFMRLALVLAVLADLRCKFLSWRAVQVNHRQVSEPLLELRAPLVRPLQVVEPAAPRPFEPAARAPRAARPP